MPKQFATFLWQFARRPVATGAIAPSSHGLAHRMCDNMRVEDADVIFEFGAGTGSFTVEILERMKPDATFVAVEVNPRMVEHLRRRFTELTILDESAENVREFREKRGIGPIDCILCGLPWASFSGDLQDRLLGSVMENLRPGGSFATFAYIHACWLPPGRRLRRKLRDHFDSVETTRPVWWNLPPAFVYQCRKA